MKENRIFVLKINEPNGNILFQIYNNKAGINKASYLSVGESIPSETDDLNWEKLKSRCSVELKKHLISLTEEKSFKSFECRVEYGDEFETSIQFAHHKSLHIDSLHFSYLKHTSPMEKEDIRLFQAAFNSIK